MVASMLRAQRRDPAKVQAKCAFATNYPLANRQLRSPLILRYRMQRDKPYYQLNQWYNIIYHEPRKPVVHSRLSAPLPCGWRSVDIEAWPFPSPIPSLTPFSRFPRHRHRRRWPRLVGQPVGLIKVYFCRRSCRHVISGVASTGPRLPSPTRSSAEVRVTALQL